MNSYIRASLRLISSFCGKYVLPLVITTLGMFSSSVVLAGCPGCCSYHGGISSSCSADGRIYCADGSVSPSCTCANCGVPYNPGSTCKSVPGMPTNLTATPGDGQISLSFTVPSNGGTTFLPDAFGTGSPITGYLATCGSITAFGTAPPIVVTGLTNGITYSCSVVAMNCAGAGPSSASVSATPAAPAPDLLISAFNAPSSGQAGTKINVSATVTNRGVISAPSSRLGFYFSQNLSVGPGTVYTGNYCSISAMAVNASTICSGAVTIPGFLTPGSYFIGAYADDQNAIAESNESNNAMSVPITVSASSIVNYSDSWWNPNESGWGLNVTDHGTNLFVQWYTFDQTGHNQKYVIAGGTLTEDKCKFNGTLSHVTGPSWTLSSFDPSQVTRMDVGSASLDFCPVGLPAGTMNFDYTVDGISGHKQLVRLPFGDGITNWGGISNTGGPDFTDLWWNRNESGWGVSITQHGTNVFARIFVYDVDNKPLLFVMPGATFTNPYLFTGVLQSTTGPWFGSSTFDPNQVNRTTVGIATFSFTDANNGTLTYTVNGITKTKVIARLSF